MASEWLRQKGKCILYADFLSHLKERPPPQQNVDTPLLLATATEGKVSAKSKLQTAKISFKSQVRVSSSFVFSFALTSPVTCQITVHHTAATATTTTTRYFNCSPALPVN